MPNNEEERKSFQKGWLSRPMSGLEIGGLALYFGGMALLILYFLIGYWPVSHSRNTELLDLDRATSPREKVEIENLASSQSNQEVIDGKSEPKKDNTKPPIATQKSDRSEVATDDEEATSTSDQRGENIVPDTYVIQRGEIGEDHLLILVIMAGALGAFVHATTSFVTFLGNRTLLRSWGLWYVFRPFIGVAMALIVYFIFRGGLLSAHTGASAINIYGICAVSALSGMFSKQAVDKLEEVFENLFPSEGDAKREDKLQEHGR